MTAPAYGDRSPPPFFGDRSLPAPEILRVNEAIRRCPHRRPTTCHGYARCALGKGSHRGRVSHADCRACVSSSPSAIADETSSSEMIETSEATAIGNPELIDGAGRPLKLRGCRRGRGVALFCGGPSLAALDLDPWMAPWVDRAAVNNSGALVRPHWWFCVDEPKKFHQDIWEDPNCFKFVAHSHSQYPTRRKEHGSFTDGPPACSFPGTILYRRHTRFDHREWLVEDTFSYGRRDKEACPLGVRGARSVLFVALKALAVLGYRTIVLLGCDWMMNEAGPQYGFAQTKDARAASSNNGSYTSNGKRMQAIRPIAEAAGIRILNANPNSYLLAFDRVTPEAGLSAIADANRTDPDLAGWYEA